MRKPTSEEYTNVFSGGKVRKKRSRLEEAAVNPEKGQKLLNYHLNRLLEVRSRDAEGTRDPGLNRRSAQKNTTPAEPEQAEPEVPTFMSMAAGDKDSPGANIPADEPEAAEADHSTSWGQPTSAAQRDPPSPEDAPGTEATSSDAEAFRSGSGPATGPRRRKSVRWVDSPAETMDIDKGSLFIPNDNDMGSQDSTTADEELSLLDSIKENRQRRPGVEGATASQSLARPCRLAQSGPNALNLSFECLPVDCEASWFTKFRDADCLEFTHQCSAHDFTKFDAAGTMRSEKFAAGSVRAVDAHKTLAIVEQRLKISTTALLCHYAGICILLWPGSSLEWQSNNAGKNSTSAQTGLCYSIFTPGSSLNTRLLEPFNKDLAAQEQSDGFVGAGNVFTPQELLNFDYSRLQPSNVRAQNHHVFFLLFHNAAANEGAMLSRWLRQCNPDCTLLVSLVPSHWYSFKKHGRGVLIIDEDALETVRMIPGLEELLSRRDSVQNVAVWAFMHSLHTFSPLQPTKPELPATRPAR